MNNSSLIPVERAVTCNRCGDPEVAWLQNKAGKWYLVQANRDSSNGQVYAQKFNFHSTHCKGAK